MVLVRIFIAVAYKVNNNNLNNLNQLHMLRWAAIFLVIAIVAAIFGFGGISEGAADIAKVLFFIFLAGLVLVLVLGGTIFKK